MILDEIAAKTRERMEAEKRRVSPADMRKLAAEAKARAEGKTEAKGMAYGGRRFPGNGLPGNRFPEKKLPFEAALAKPGMSFICEVKKASPSKGIIAEQFPYADIAREYEAAGADAISVLTEPFYFMGSDNYLSEIRRQVSIPLLRKDFTVDEYMLYQAKVIGADAVLLICAILSPMQLSEYRAIAGELGLSALVEVHDEREVEMALGAGADIVGANNRNLKDFTVDIDNSLRLRKLVPKNILFVSESGMKTREDIARLEENGTDGALIGESFMRSGDKAGFLKKLRGRV